PGPCGLGAALHARRAGRLQPPARVARPSRPGKGFACRRVPARLRAGPRAAARPCLSAQAALAARPPSVAAGLVRAALLPPRGPAARAKARLFLRIVSPGRKVKVKVKGAQIASFYRYKKAHLIQSFPRSPRPLPMGER